MFPLSKFLYHSWDFNKRALIGVQRILGTGSPNGSHTGAICSYLDISEWPSPYKHEPGSTGRLTTTDFNRFSTNHASDGMLDLFSVSHKMCPFLLLNMMLMAVNLFNVCNAELGKSANSWNYACSSMYSGIHLCSHLDRRLAHCCDPSILSSSVAISWVGQRYVIPLPNILQFTIWVFSNCWLFLFQSSSNTLDGCNLASNENPEKGASTDDQEWAWLPSFLTRLNYFFSFHIHI